MVVLAMHEGVWGATDRRAIDFLDALRVQASVWVYRHRNDCFEVKVLILDIVT